MLFVPTLSPHSYYTIVAPENIRPNTDYQLWITVHNRTEPSVISVSIVDTAISYTNKAEITITDEQPQSVSLSIGNDIDPTGNYKLIAEGVSGLIFKNESSLLVEKKSVSLFIQTDKAIYKPGETIRFRVIVLDYLLRPAQVDRGDLVIYITVWWHFSRLQANKIW